MNKEQKTKGNKNLSGQRIRRKEDYKKSLEWNVPKHKPEFKNYQSNFLFYISNHANEVKRFKIVNGIK